MSAHHTPGPWTVYGPWNDEIWTADLEDSVAECHGEDEQVRCANARLIAAAPLMRDELEAIVNLLAPLTEASLAGGINSDTWYRLTKRFNAARAAIRAAKGETAHG